MPGKCKFQDAWLKATNYKSWLVKDSNTTRAKCGLCDRAFDISNMGEAALKSHMKGAKHMSKITGKQQGTSIEGFLKSSSGATASAYKSNVETGSDHDKRPEKSDNTAMEEFVTREEVLKSEIVWLLHSVEKHQSYKSNIGIEKVFQKMFPDSYIAKDFQCGENKSAYTCCFEMAPYFSDLLRKRVGDNKYVLLFDASLNKVKNQSRWIYMPDCGMVSRLKQDT